MEPQQGGCAGLAGDNMMTEARAGFRAFNEGTKTQQEVDFVALRQALAQGQRWTEEFTEGLMPGKHEEGS